mgnify:CR=1 FL=1
MPFYKFKCPNCGVFEELMEVDGNYDECPKCGNKNIKKVMTTAKVHYNGLGFYSSTPYGEKNKG